MNLIICGFRRIHVSYCFYPFLPLPPPPFLNKPNWGASTTTKSTSSTSVHRHRRHRQTDIDDVDLEVVSLPFRRHWRGGIGNCAVVVFKGTKKRLTYSCKSAFLMHGVRDSNPRPSVLETDILPTKLTPCGIINYKSVGYMPYYKVAPPGIEPGSNL